MTQEVRLGGGEQVGPHEPTTVTLAIKNPSKANDNFVLSVGLDDTVEDIRRRISESYEGHPSPQSQTLIYSGKVLKDSSVSVRQILKRPWDLSVPHSMHMVLKDLPQRFPAPDPAVTQKAPARPAGQPSQLHRRPTATDRGSDTAGPSSAGTSASATQSTPRSEERGATASAGTPSAQPPLMQQVPPGSAPMLPYILVNPIMAAAYQAAYAAALTAATNATAELQQQQQQQQREDPSHGLHSFQPGYAPAIALYYPSFGQVGPEGYPYPPGLTPGGFYPPQPSPAPMRPNFNAMPIRNQIAHGLRQHFANAYGFRGEGQNGRGDRVGHRHRRSRTITFRISARTLLQLIVFVLVLYQHYSWQRMLMLTAIAVLLYSTTFWQPLRRGIANLTVALAQRAAGPQQQQQQQPGQEQQGQQGQLGAQPQTQLPGFVGEVVTLILGFVTSLLPVWNVNPEDAAVFAAAQMQGRDREDEDDIPQGDEPGEEGGAGLQPNGPQRAHQD